MLNVSVSSQNEFINILSSVLKIPGIKISRTDFLKSSFRKNYSGQELENIILHGPVKAGLSQKEIDKIADNIINTKTMTSSGASFLAGLPGGFTMLATVPADVTQFFGISIILAQEIAYLYGMDDMWRDGILEASDSEIMTQFVLYLACMFGTGGAAQGIRVMSAELSKKVINKQVAKQLSKTWIYKMAQKLGKILGVKVTQKTFSQAFSKAIPIVGGVLSGGITFCTMKPMGKRLKNTLSHSCFKYTETEYIQDVEYITNFNNSEDIIDI